MYEFRPKSKIFKKPLINDALLQAEINTFFTTPDPLIDRMVDKVKKSYVNSGQAVAVELEQLDKTKYTPGKWGQKALDLAARKSDGIDESEPAHNPMDITSSWSPSMKTMYENFLKPTGQFFRDGREIKDKVFDEANYFLNAGKKIDQSLSGYSLPSRLLSNGIIPYKPPEKGSWGADNANGLNNFITSAGNAINQDRLDSMKAGYYGRDVNGPPRL